MRHTPAVILAVWATSSLLIAQDHPRRLVAPTPIGPVPTQYGPVIVGPPVVVQPPYVTTYPPQSAFVPYQVVPAAATRPSAVTTTVRRVESELPKAPLVLEVGEGFANRLFSTRRVENGPVTDVVLDAAVQGWRRTTTNVSVDFVPSASGARFDVRAQGTNQSDTLGATERATVRTLGTQTFTVSKPVLFDGKSFLVQRARGAVNPSNQTVGAWTKYDDVPILGRIATRTAYRKAAERQPVTERISADRLAQQLIPRFNKEVNDQLTAANVRLKAQRKTLSESGMWPDRSALSSADRRLTWAAWFEGTASPRTAPKIASRDDECGLVLHESLVRRFVDRLELGGRVFQKADFDAALRTFAEFAQVEQPIEKKDDPQAALAALVKYVFDEDRPLTVDFADGQVVIGMRISLRPAVGPDIGPHDVRIVVAPRSAEGQIVLVPSEVDVTPVTPSEAGAEQVAGLIEQRLKARVPTIRIDQSQRLPASVTGGQGLSLRLVGLDFDDEWCTLRIR